MFLGPVSVAGCFMVSIIVFVNGFRYVFVMVSVAGFLVDSAAAGGSNILERIERFLVYFCVFKIGFRRWFLLMVSATFCFMVSVTISYGFRYVCLLFPSLDFWWILPPQGDPIF